MTHNRLTESGFTLLGMVSGLLVASFVTYLAVMGWNSFHKTSQIHQEVGDARSALRSIGIFLRSKLQGPNAFSGVYLNLPSAPSGKSYGPGIYVLKDTDIDGNSSEGNDLLICTFKKPMTGWYKLASDLSGSPASISLASVTGTGPINATFQTGDILAVSNNQTTELIKLTGSVPGTTSGNISLSAALGAFAYLFSAPTLQSSYRAGDFVYKAEILKIGISPSNERLIARDYSSGESMVIGERVKALKISYHLMDEPKFCAALTTTGKTFSRADWSTINADASKTCYYRIDLLRLNYVVETEGKATKDREENGEYTFKLY